jgi:hypothetical protein
LDPVTLLSGQLDLLGALRLFRTCRVGCGLVLISRTILRLLRRIVRVFGCILRLVVVGCILCACLIGIRFIVGRSFLGGLARLARRLRAGVLSGFTRLAGAVACILDRFASAAIGPIGAVAAIALGFWLPRLAFRLRFSRCARSIA